MSAFMSPWCPVITYWHFCLSPAIIMRTDFREVIKYVGFKQRMSMRVQAELPWEAPSSCTCVCHCLQPNHLCYDRDDQSQQGCVSLCNLKIFSTCWALMDFKDRHSWGKPDWRKGDSGPKSWNINLIRREILRVKNWFHLILHLEDPGLSSKWRHPPTRHSRNVRWCSTFHILCKQEGKTTTCTSHYWDVLHRSWHSDIRHWYREASRHRGHQCRLSQGRSQDKMETRTFEAVRSSHVFSILNIWDIFWIVGFSTLKSYCCCYLV